MEDTEIIYNHAYLITSLQRGQTPRELETRLKSPFIFIPSEERLRIRQVGPANSLLVWLSGMYPGIVVASVALSLALVLAKIWRTVEEIKNTRAEKRKTDAETRKIDTERRVLILDLDKKLRSLAPRAAVEFLFGQHEKLRSAGVDVDVHTLQDFKNQTDILVEQLEKIDAPHETRKIDWS
jgi:hypothetical protein